MSTLSITATAIETEIFAVTVVKASCASPSFFVNASALFDLTVGDETFSVELQNGHTFDFGDFNCPSNAMHYYSISAATACDDDNLRSIETIASWDNLDDIDELLEDEELTYTVEQIEAIAAIIRTRISESQRAIAAIESQYDDMAYNDNHAYLLVKSADNGELYSLRFADGDAAQSFIDTAESGKYWSIDSVDEMTAYQHCNDNMSNFTFTIEQ